MGNIQINNFNIADLEQAIKNVITENVVKSVIQELRPNQRGLTIYTRELTAKTLCISLPTLNDWTKNGIIKAFRIGNRVLYKLEDINDALKEVERSVKRGGKSC
ncbi:MAG: helix-turn-helix domain-containing protein [Ignavibacteriae bacterium]|nr:helix-turn-helix domain-containing protein [Ignavibacteriota bacterium]